MKSTKIYMYDNNIGIDIPKKIGVYPVDVVFGSTISDIHKSIMPCQLFCVFTPIQKADIIVQSSIDKAILRSIFKFGNKSYNIDVKESSIWYSDRADKNIIFSGDLGLDGEDLKTILSMYISEVIAQYKAEHKYKISMYFVKNTRSGEELIRTPNLQDAINLCNTRPCTAVFTRDNEIVYKTRFGKLAVPMNRNGHVNRMKAKHPDSNGIFKVKQR